MEQIKNKPTLAGVTFVWNGIKQDYCFIETVKSLIEFCDYVIVLAGGDDGTFELLSTVDLGIPKEMVGKVFIHKITQEEWDAQQGRQKLAYFQNAALSFVRGLCDWYFLLQCDEITDPRSYEHIRHAITKDEEGYYCTRINLWGNCYHMLNVPESRSPVGTNIIRLARTFYPSVDDGESCLCDARDHYVNDIKIVHYGFVRLRDKHIVKIKHIQDEVFQIPHDTRVDGLDKFDPWNAGFTPADVVPIDFQHSPVIQAWVEERNHTFDKW